MKPTGTQELFQRMLFVTRGSTPAGPKTIHLERGEVMADLRRHGVPEATIYKHFAEGFGIVSADRLVENDTGKLTWNVTVRSGLFGDKMSNVTLEHQPPVDEAKDESGEPIKREWASKPLADQIIVQSLGENLSDTVFDPHPVPLIVLNLAETVGNKNAYQLFTELDKKLRQAHWSVTMNEQRRWVVRPLREVTFQEPTNEQLVAMGIAQAQSLGVVGATGATTPSDDIPGVKELSKLFGDKAQKVQEALKKAKTGEEKAELMGKACKYLKAEGVGHVKCETGGITYLEMADPYDTTLLYDHAEHGFRVGSYGEYVEARASRFAHVLDESGELALDKKTCASCMGMGRMSDASTCSACEGVGRVKIDESSPTTRVAAEAGPRKKLPTAAMLGHSTDTVMKVGAAEEDQPSDGLKEAAGDPPNTLDEPKTVGKPLSTDAEKNNAVANTGKTPDDGNQVPLNKEGDTKPTGEAKDGPKTSGKPLSGDPQGQPGDGPSGDAPVVGKWIEGDADGEPKTTGDKMLGPANPFGTEPKYTDDKNPQKGSQKLTEAKDKGEPPKTDGAAKTSGTPLVKDAETNKETNAGGGFKSLKKTPLEQVSTKLAEALVEGKGKKPWVKPWDKDNDGKTDDKEDDKKDEIEEAKKWIAGAIEHEGSLRKHLGKKEGEKISDDELDKVIADPEATPKRKKQAQLAKTLKGMREAFAEIEADPFV